MITSQTISALAKPSPYELARRVEVAGPESLTSPGAAWLTSVWEAMVEALLYMASSDPVSEDDLSDQIAETADGMVPVYDSELWRVVEDLALYAVDLSDLGTPKNMTEGARWATYLVAERVCHLVVEALYETEEEGQ